MLRAGGVIAVAAPSRHDSLPTEKAVTEYLVGKGVPAERAETGAASVKPPLRVTKRGALAFARKG